MMVCAKQKIVFVAIPKTATRSIYRFLANEYDGKIQGDHKTIIPSDYKDFFKFAVVREPYDRLCSAYWHSCWRPDRDRYQFEKRMKERGLPNTFESFLEIIQDPNTRGRHATTQTSYLANNTFDMLLRFETLSEDFNKLPFLEHPVELDVVNSTYSKPFKSRKVRPANNDKLLTPRAIELINKVYRNDFEKLGYEMREPE